MKTYFKQLFDYDHHANHQILKTIIENNSPQKATALMAHLLRAQQVWLSRCAGQPATPGTLWPDWSVDALTPMIDENYAGWSSYLNFLNEEEFEKIIAYKPTSGVPYEDKL